VKFLGNIFEEIQIVVLRTVTRLEKKTSSLPLGQAVLKSCLP